MANVKFFFAIVLLLAFAFFHAVNSVEGRQLKIGKTKESNNKPITPTEKTETASRKLGENPSTLLGNRTSKATPQVANEFQPAEPAAPLDDSPSPPQVHAEVVRPTVSGDSPGAGHSVHN